MPRLHSQSLSLWLLFPAGLAAYRSVIINSIKAYRVYRSRGVIAKFDKFKYDEYFGFARIGEGSLGGKGRGLAFIDSFLKRKKTFQ